MDPWPNETRSLDGRRASGDAGRPRVSAGPGFLEIVSGPGPLNALYVSCNLIPRRSARCPDRRVIYANSWASGSVREVRRASWVSPSKSPDATAVPLRFRFVAAFIRQPYVATVRRRSSSSSSSGRRRHCLADSPSR